MASPLTLPSEDAGRQTAVRANRSFKLAAIVGSTFFAIAITEIALWLFFPTPYHQWMEWRADGHIAGRGQPGVSFRTADGYEIRINQLGFRGPDPTWRPAPGTLRIVAFGGSSTFNFHAHGEKETWAGFLRSALAEDLEMNIEVINAALPGFTAVHSKINYLIAGRQLHPHVVILYHTWNDMKKFRPLERSPQGVVFAGVVRNKPLWQNIAREFQIPRLFRNVYHRYNQERRETRYTSLEETGHRADMMPLPIAFDWARQNYEDFVRFARNDDVLPVLISQATIAVKENLDDPAYRVAIGNEMVGMTLPVLADSWSRMSDIVREVAAQEDAVFVDGYSGVPHDFSHLTDAVHLTREGCLRLGKLIAKGLLDNREFKELADRVRLAGC